MTFSDAFNFFGSATTGMTDKYFEGKFEDKVHVVHIVLGLLSLLEKEYHFQGLSTLLSGHHLEDKNFGLSLVLNAELLGLESLGNIYCILILILHKQYLISLLLG